MNWIDGLILAAYLAFTLGHGWWFYKQSDSASHFMAGGGQIPAWAAGLSVLGTFLSSVTFLTYPGKGCAENWNAMVFALTLPIGAVIAVWLFIPFYRRMGVISIFGYLEDRFGLSARIYGNICMFLAQLGRAGFTLYLVCGALVSVIGAATKETEYAWILGALLVLGAFVTAYTMLGGIEAVIWTDVVQVIILIGGALLCLVLLLAQTEGGLSGTVSAAYEAGKFSFGPWDAQTRQSGSLFDLSLVTNTFLVTFLFGAFENVKNYNFEMVYVQRYATVKSIGAARRSVWVSVAMYMVLSALFLFVGTALYGYYHQSPELTAQLGKISTSDKIFPAYIGGLPAGVRGIMLVAILAAAISTVDSAFNVVATIFYSDIFKRFFQKTPPPTSPAAATPAPPPHEARVLRISTLVMGILTTLFAVACINQKNILDQIWAFAGLTGGGLVGLFLIGLLLRKARGRDALIAVLVATPLTVLFAIWSDANMYRWVVDNLWASLPACPLHKTLTLPVSVILHVAVGLISSWLGRSAADDSLEQHQARYNLTIFGFKNAVARGAEIAAEPATDPAAPEAAAETSG